MKTTFVSNKLLTFEWPGTLTPKAGTKINVVVVNPGGATSAEWQIAVE